MKIKTMLFTLAGLSLFTLAAVEIINQPPRAAYAGYPPNCQYANYGCSLPVGFRGWPQLP
ncbi:hypothetical protein [Metapseudomonas resinovorans]|uniref:hypothetical protein n=1 Tax=Metapseudomonas resinovorans TaxID=53412 RepID=UPI0012DE9D7E|nr:hypothetical protein [Pseudomonas resinovorans]